MPKVSKEHLEGRRDHILRAAARCFARDGFHQTTISDILREAQVSNGSLFLYFKTKEDLVEAVVTRTVATMARLFRDLTRDTDDPAEAVITSIHTMADMMDDPDRRDVVRLFPQIFSELERNPALRAETTELFGEIASHFATLARAAKRSGRLAADRPDLGTANLMVSLFQGYIIQRLNFGEYFHDGEYLMAIRAALAP